MNIKKSIWKAPESIYNWWEFYSFIFLRDNLYLLNLRFLLDFDCSALFRNLRLFGRLLLACSLISTYWIIKRLRAFLWRRCEAVILCFKFLFFAACLNWNNCWTVRARIYLYYVQSVGAFCVNLLCKNFG